jgi:hypothetical protein
MGKWHSQPEDCTVCGKPSLCLGLCVSHYKKQRREQILAMLPHGGKCPGHRQHSWAVSGVCLRCGCKRFKYPR